MSIRGQAGSGRDRLDHSGGAFSFCSSSVTAKGGKSLLQGSAVEDAKPGPGMEGAVWGQRGRPTSPLQSQVTEGNTARANSSSACERESCWKGKYLGMALPRGCRGGCCHFGEEPGDSGNREWRRGRGLTPNSAPLGHPGHGSAKGQRLPRAPRPLGILPSSKHPRAVLAVPTVRPHTVPAHLNPFPRLLLLPDKPSSGSG